MVDLVDSAVVALVVDTTLGVLEDKHEEVSSNKKYYKALLFAALQRSNSSDFIKEAELACLDNQN